MRHRVALTPDQQIEYELFQQCENKRFSNYCFTISVNRVISQEYLIQALQQCIYKQPTLRMIFPESMMPNEALCFAAEEVAIDFTYMPYSCASDRKALVEQKTQQPFVLEKTPPWRLIAFPLDEETQLSLVMHHVICDVRSFVVFFRELTQGLSLKHQERSVSSGFEKLQNRFLPQTCCEEFWRTQLSFCQPASLLVEPINQAPCYRIEKRLHGMSYKQLTEKAMQMEAGVAAVFLSIFQLAYTQQSQREHFLIGMPVDLTYQYGRKTIGYYAAQRPVRYEGHRTFADLCRFNEQQLQQINENYAVDLRQVIPKEQSLKAISQMPIVLSVVKLSSLSSQADIGIKSYPVTKAVQDRHQCMW